MVVHKKKKETLYLTMNVERINVICQVSFVELSLSSKKTGFVELGDNGTFLYVNYALLSLYIWLFCFQSTVFFMCVFVFRLASSWP